jgi:hypothetical protein
MLFIGLLRSVIVIGNYTHFFEKLARREQRRIAVIVVFFLFTGDKHIGIKKLFLVFYVSSPKSRVARKKNSKLAMLFNL